MSNKPVKKEQSTQQQLTLSGVQKAALLLIALDVDTASQVLKYLDGNDVEHISAEITKVRNIPSVTAETVMHDFYNLIIAREYMLEGGIEYAQKSTREIVWSFEGS